MMLFCTSVKCTMLLSHFIEAIRSEEESFVCDRKVCLMPGPIVFNVSGHEDDAWLRVSFMKSLY
jgi:tellurite resistance-related uncharacterized protein